MQLRVEPIESEVRRLQEEQRRYAGTAANAAASDCWRCHVSALSQANGPLGLP